MTLCLYRNLYPCPAVTGQTKVKSKVKIKGNDMLSDNAQLAWDTIRREPRKEIPVGGILNPMEWAIILS